jgi:hypothetical protein
MMEEGDPLVMAILRHWNGLPGDEPYKIEALRVACEYVFSGLAVLEECKGEVEGVMLAERRN